MDFPRRGRCGLTATIAMIILAATASSAELAEIPHDLPKAAGEAMRLAQKWHSDAQMIDLRIRQSNNYVLEFNFSSPTDRSTFYVQLIKGQFTSQVMPPVTTTATGDPLPLEFLDLPAAIVQAEQQGMPHMIKEADLQAFSNENPKLAWAIQPETDNPPYLYTINAAAGLATNLDQSPKTQDSHNVGNIALNANPAGGAASASAVVEPVMASGLLQKCLGITRGVDRMMRGPATQPYCRAAPWRRAL